MSTIINQQPDQKEIEMRNCLLSNNDRGFSKFYDHFSPALFGLINNWVKDREIAENLLQDVFVKAWRSRELYDAAKGKVFTWLYNISRHTCIDYLRSKTYRKYKASLLSEDISHLTQGFTPGNISPDTIGLRKLVSSLRKEEQDVIELMYFSGLTQREIAVVMDTPLGTVKTRVSRAIKNLRYYFKKDWKEAARMVSLN